MTTNHNPFGLLAFLHWNHDWNKYAFRGEILTRAVEQIKELGVGMIRTDLLWSDIHKGPNHNSYAKYDEIVDLLQKNNIQVLGLLHYNKTEAREGTVRWNTPPDSPEEFARYVSDTVQRYRGWIKHWEIWNEPNHDNYWSGPKDDLKKYCELLRLSYQAAKKADPDCTVINGGFAHPIPEAVRDLYTAGGANIFDAVNIHPFIDPLGKSPAEELEKIITKTKKIMDESGDGQKKIWITEIGCPGIPDGEKWQDWFQGKGVSEHEQAEWLEQLFRVCRRFNYVDKVFWAFYRDTDQMFMEAADYLGLVRKNLSPKPAFFRMKSLIEDLRKD